MKVLKILLLAFLLALPAMANPLSGKVYGVFPEGVMVDYGAGSYLIPSQQATFEVGGIRATWTSLQPGQIVNVQVPDPYWPSLTQISDPYQWKMKHHPNHPHGGPPGQMKKHRRKNHKNKHKGKKKGW